MIRHNELGEGVARRKIKWLPSCGFGLYRPARNGCIVSSLGDRGVLRMR